MIVVSSRRPETTAVGRCADCVKTSAQWEERGLHWADHSEWPETKAEGVTVQGGNPTVIPGLYFMTERSGREELHLAIMAWWTFTAAPNRCECFIFWYLSNESPDLEGKSGISCINFLLTFAHRSALRCKALCSSSDSLSLRASSRSGTMLLKQGSVGETGES
jgi:hypothetical protein